MKTRSQGQITRFRLPGEWEAQSAVLITWPHPQSDWAENLLQIESLYLQLSNAIAQYEKLVIIAYDRQLQQHIEQLLAQKQIDSRNIQFFISPTNDTWIRDYGPICLTDKTTTDCLIDEFNRNLIQKSSLDREPLVRLLNFNFNGWGNKYPALLDNELNHRLLHNNVLHPAESQTINFVLEGGSIESDGNGTLLTTSSCLLTVSRNAGYNQKDIACYLQKTLGVSQILWLDHGTLVGDDTDSHIDQLARFVNAETLVYVKCEDPNDEHFSSFTAMADQLHRFRNCDGKPYHLVPLPFPRPIFDKNNRRLAASYANFLIINHAVLVPIYDDPSDKIALNILQKCFKKRTVIGIPFKAAIQQNGSLHCLTMQLPVGL